MLIRTVPYTVEAFGQTDMGLVRENNEDAWRISPVDNVFILADGMGGHAAGEIAAQTAVESYALLLKEYLPPNRTLKEFHQAQEILSQLIAEVNKTIYRMSRAEVEMRGMGTTLCCSFFHPEGVIIGHVGDSRAYLFRENQLQQLTEDHSLVQELVGLGELNPKQAKSYSHRNIITKAIGTEPFVEATLGRYSVAIGDLIMMCSDGLTDLLSHEHIEHLLSQSLSLENRIDSLIKEANRQGGYDNITVVLMQIKEPLPDRAF